MPTCDVLFETYEDGIAVGHTASFAEVAVHAPCDLRGRILPVRLLRSDDRRIEGELLLSNLPKGDPS